MDPLADYRKNKELYEETPHPVASWYEDNFGPFWHDDSMEHRLFVQWEKWQIINDGDAVLDRGYIYLLRTEDGLYKIGRTSKPDDRIKTLKIQLPFAVKVFVVGKVHSSYELESFLHTSLAQYRMNGEWFKIPDYVAHCIKRCINERILD